MSLAAMAFVASIVLVAAFFVDVSNRRAGNPQVPPYLTARARFLLVATLLALLLSIVLTWLAPLPPVAQETANRQDTAVEITSAMCTVYDFVEGDHRVPSGGLTTLKQDREKCVDDLVSRLKTATPREIFLVGHSDKRELRPSSSRVYGTNQSLAQQRAESVLVALDAVRGPEMSRLDPIAVRLSAGAQHVGADVSPDDLARDRKVDIRTSWVEAKPATTAAADRPPQHGAFGFALNSERLDPGVSLAFLAFIVGLSAYLATIRTYLGTIAASGSYKIRKNRALITVADLPMIAAAFCVGMHVFRFWSARWLRVGMVLFLFAGIVMVIMHAREWFGSFHALFLRDTPHGPGTPPVVSGVATLPTSGASAAHTVATPAATTTAVPAPAAPTVKIAQAPVDTRKEPGS